MKPLEWVESLIFHDFDFLSLYKDYEEHLYLKYWMDRKDIIDYYLFVRLNKEDLEEYSQMKITLLQLLNKTEHSVIIWSESVKEDEIVSICDINDIPDKNLPVK